MSDSANQRGREMGDFKIVCFTLFTIAQHSNAGKTKILDPENDFVARATIFSLSAREPNQNVFTPYSSAKKMYLGVHHDGCTLSFYVCNAPNAFFTFKNRQVDFEILHSTAMSFRVKEKRDIHHFRVVFSATNYALDTLYSLLSAHTGHGDMAFKMNITRVESYAKTDRMRDAIINQVEDLDSAAFFEQKVASGRAPTRMIFKIAPFTPRHTQPEAPRLVFRTGAFRAARVNDKVVLELSGFEYCLYIFYFRDSFRAETFMSFINLAGDDETLDIDPDVRTYLESGPQSTSQSDRGDPRALPSVSGKHSRDDQRSSRNVRYRSDDDFN